MRKALFIMDRRAYELTYGEQHCREIKRLVDVIHPPLTTAEALEKPELLRDVEIIFTGWGAPRLDEAFLNATPDLQAVFYGAGSIRHLITETSWSRGIRVTSAYAANAIPVSEFTVAAVLFALKRVWHFARKIREDRSFPDHHDVPGAFHTTVGLVSLGMIGRLVRQRLQAFDLEVLAYDPFLEASVAAELEVESVDLDTLFARSQVVSLHTPLLASTRNLIRGKHLASMRPNATFINTSRGAVVHQEEMIEVLRRRPDLQAVLDVTHPEPPPADSSLYTLPNVLLTPHVAGSSGPECRRMGAFMIDELRRYLDGEPLQWEITREQAEIMA
jgi:phosphoglycerate dehydrogenase-like enzyme